MPLLLASIPTVSLVPPNGQLAPAGSATVSISAFAPLLPLLPLVPGDPGSPLQATSVVRQPATRLPRNRDRQRSRMMILRAVRSNSTVAAATHVPGEDCAVWCCAVTTREPAAGGTDGRATAAQIAVVAER